MYHALPPRFDLWADDAFGYHPRMGKPVIGLTGGIASGKSTVARLLAERGAAVIDADQLARDVVAKGTVGLAEIVKTFGTEILATDGTLDRAKLGTMVFADDAKRKKLEAITHPLIGLEGLRRMALLQDGPAPYVVYEAALLVETGRYQTFSALIVVAVSPETQLARLVGRDHLPEERALERIASQFPMEKKTSVATWVIRNEGSLADLERDTDEVHRAIVERFQLEESRP